MLDPDTARTEPAIQVRIDGYRVDPPVVILADLRGPLIARTGSRRAVIVNRAAAESFRRLAPTGVLRGPIPAELEPAEAGLMGLLTARGLARTELSLIGPLPPVAVIVPTYGRVAGLRRCLASIRALRYPSELLEIVVVDDAHPEGDRVARETGRAGGRLIRRRTNGGPAAARNSGVDASTARIIAFVDSDCVVPPDWLVTLLPELADRETWAVAARVRGIADASAIGRYEAVRSPLDMGALAHDLDLVDGRSFVPSANLVMTRDAFRRAGGFDETLRIGEDVDLCLRILDMGGRVRYVTRTTVGHERRRTVAAFARQRALYAASEPRLVARHPSLARKLPIPAVPVSAALVLLGKPLATPVPARIAIALGVMGTQMLAWRRWSQHAWPGARGAGSGWRASIRSTGAANLKLVDGLARQFARHQVVPVSLVAGRFRPRSTIRAALILLLWAGVSDFVRSRPRLDPIRFVILHAVDDLAYNAGLVVGTVRARDPRAYLGRVEVTSGLPRSQPPELRPAREGATASAAGAREP